jgi:hypothetical protein
VVDPDWYDELDELASGREENELVEESPDG